MLGTAIPGEGRWFQNSVVFGMKIVLKKVKKSFVTTLAKRTVQMKLSFIFFQEHFNSEISVFVKKTCRFFCFRYVGAIVLVLS